MNGNELKTDVSLGNLFRKSANTQILDDEIMVTFDALYLFTFSLLSQSTEPVNIFLTS